MKKTKWLLALSLASCMGYAQLIWPYAGTSWGFSGDGGLATSAKIYSPFTPAMDASGNLYIPDAANNRIRKVTPTGIISTFAGTGVAGSTGDGGAATSAKLDYPTCVAVYNNEVYIADYHNHSIRKVNTSGIISRVAGTGTAGSAGDGGPATSAALNYPNTVAFDANGVMYISDQSNYRIRQVSGGTMTTFAGNGLSGYSGDGGAPTSAKLNTTWGIATSGSNPVTVYIGDNGNSVVRKVVSGVISTFAGTGGTFSYSGDGGAATSATLNGTTSLAVDASGNVYIGDWNNFCIRKVNTSGTISTYAGTGTQGYTGNGGNATAANCGTMCVAINGADLYLADRSYDVIRKVSSVCPANAGPNKANTCGACCITTTVSIGTASVTNMNYAWTCSGTCNLSSTTAAQPNAWPCSIGTPTTYTVTVSGTGCTTATSTMTITSTTASPGCCKITGISNQNQDGETFSVYPNPSNSEITIKLSDGAEYVQIMDVTSKVVFEIKSIQNKETVVDVSKYAKGIYFVIAKVGGTVEKQKLVIQ